MAGSVSWVLELQVQPGRSDELRTLMEEMVSSTHAQESGTQGYEWFMSADGNQCHLYERYADSAAALAHCQTFGARFAGRFMSLLTPTRCTVYGSPDASVQRALSVLRPTYMGQAAGFHR
jgi:quinol monooxygenase YgiN